MTPFETLVGFAQSSGLIYFLAIFCAVLAYVLWPNNRKTFAAAAQIPLRADEDKP